MLDWQKVTIGGGDDAGGFVTVDKYWYLTEDKTRVVEEGHPESRWLWASPGTQVPRRDAIRYGALVEEPEPEAAVAESEPEAEPEKSAEDKDPAEGKQAKPAANKAAKKATNKAADKAEDK